MRFHCVHLLRCVFKLDVVGVFVAAGEVLLALVGMICVALLGVLLR